MAKALCKLILHGKMLYIYEDSLARSFMIVAMFVFISLVGNEIGDTAKIL